MVYKFYKLSEIILDISIVRRYTYFRAKKSAAHLIKCMGIFIAKSVFRGIAQLVEQWSPKPRAEGSNPSAPAII